MSIHNEQFKIWHEDNFFSEDTRSELSKIREDENEIKERFYRSLAFGTAGMRGIIGAGTNRINLYTIALVTEGLAQFILSLDEEAKKSGVVIGYDSRHYSKEFAERTAQVLAYHGISVKLFPQLCPTPLVSYAIRYFKTVAGVMITASHNPARFNGYKVYGSDGAQMAPAAARVITDAMDKVEDIRSLRWMDINEAMDKGLIEYLDETVDNAYVDMLKDYMIQPHLFKKHKDLKLIFTPLNGAGNILVRRILREAGLENVQVVPEQELPDPNFTTCSYPNPEERSALQYAIDLAKKENADMVFATDPDADRLGVCVKDDQGVFHVLSGNQIGVLLMEYILSSRKALGLLPDPSFVVTSIVSTRLASVVAQAYGVTLYEVLTGFKYIGELIKDLDEFGDMHYQFGFEESYGYLIEPHVRDKDAVSAAMLVAEMAVVAAEEGKTLYDKLQDIYIKYGWAVEKSFSLTLEGIAGTQQIEAIMQDLRDNPPKQLGGISVHAYRDYKASMRYQNEPEVREDEINLDVSDVLLYELTGKDWVCVRPSGTEPKLKFYVGCYASTMQAAQERFDAIVKDLKERGKF